MKTFACKATRIARNARFPNNWRSGRDPVVAGVPAALKLVQELTQPPLEPLQRFNPLNETTMRPQRTRDSLRVMQRHSNERAFTLIELLVVIAIIVILAGLLFPALRGAQAQAKRTQAKNDLTQIVTAVNAFYTEYGKYPISAATDAAGTFGPTGQTNTNNLLFNELRALA